MNTLQMNLNADRAAAKNKLFDILNGFVNPEDVNLNNADLIRVVINRWTRFYYGPTVERPKEKDNSIMAGIR
jgi:hypothetical protein